MKARQGYILLEVIVCTFIMSMLIMVLYSVTISAINTKDNIEDKIELNQQAEEMEYHIKNIVENSINIINITTTDNEVIETLQENKTYNVLSIKLNFKSEYNTFFNSLNLRIIHSVSALYNKKVKKQVFEYLSFVDKQTLKLIVKDKKISKFIRVEAFIILIFGLKVHISLQPLYVRIRNIKNR